MSHIVSKLFNVHVSDDGNDNGGDHEVDGYDVDCSKVYCVDNAWIHRHILTF